ncbi:MAG: oxidoreductase [Nocardioides sp.]|jgi:phenylpropionate dioxygenase-like ring-hydroxylating dioxygenase large terminal subunit|nr:oxidoreductase [Nocardioides sp.]
MTTHAEPRPRTGALVETLPASYYTDPTILEIEQKEIFAKTWQYVGTVDALAKPGDYITTTLVDTPIIVSRSRDGVHAMVNVCRHRFSEVASGCGNTRAFKCPYHAWTYGLDGTLVGAPRSEQIDDFDKSQLPLTKLPVAVWGPLVFVSLDPQVGAFRDWIGPVEASLREANVNFESLTMRKRTTFDIAGNWKIVAENYLECYHCLVAHPNYSRTFDTSALGYTFATDAHTFISNTAPQDRVLHDAAAAPYKADGPIGVNQNDYVWPNFAPMTWPGQNNLLIYSFRPTAVDHTIGYFDYFFDPDSDPDVERDFMAFLDEVGAEDVPLIESVQRGMASGLIDTGRLVPDENQIEHFQKLTRDAIHGGSAR